MTFFSCARREEEEEERKKKRRSQLNRVGRLTRKSHSKLFFFFFFFFLLNFARACCLKTIKVHCFDFLFFTTFAFENNKKKEKERIEELEKVLMSFSHAVQQDIKVNKHSDNTDKRFNVFFK